MNLARRGYPQHAMPNVEYDPVRRQALLQKFHAREHICSKKRNDALMVFKCPYTPEAQRFGVLNEFTRLKEQLQAIKGSDVLRDVRCVLSHPTSTVDQLLHRELWAQLRHRRLESGHSAPRGHC